MASPFTRTSDEFAAWVAGQVATRDLVLVLCNQGLTAIEISSVSAAGDSFTTSGNHGLVSGDEIVLSADGGAGVVPSPLYANNSYFVAGSINSTEFQVSDSPGGPIIDLTDSGSGTIYVKKLTWGRGATISEVVATEVPNTNNYGRQAVDIGSSTPSGIYQAYSVPSPTVISASGGSIVFDSYAFLLNGSTTYGATSGDVVFMMTVTDSAITIDPAVPRAYPLDLRFGNGNYADGIAQ